MTEDFSEWGDLGWEKEIDPPEGADVFPDRATVLASLGVAHVFDGAECGCELPFREGFASLEPCLCCAGAVGAALGNLDLEGVDALVVVPVDAGGGRRVLAPGVFRSLRQRCSAEGVKLVSDESSVPVGLSGRAFAYGYTGAVPDLVVVRLGGSMVALAAAGGDGTTKTAAADEGFALKLQLERLVSPHRGRVRGVGLLLGLALHDDRGRPDPSLAETVAGKIGVPRDGHVLLFAPAPGMATPERSEELRMAIDAALAG